MSLILPWPALASISIHNANVRQARRASRPNPVHLWRSWQNWAEPMGFTVHSREDRRPHPAQGLELLRSTVAQPPSTLNGPPTAEMEAIALRSARQWSLVARENGQE